MRGIKAGAAAADMVASEKRVCYINLSRNLLVDNEIFTSGFNEPLTVRVNWNNTSVLGAQGVAIGDARLILEQYKYSDEIRTRLLSQFLQGPKLDFPFMNPITIRGSALSVIPNALHTVEMPGVNGMITSLTVIARVAGVEVYLSKVSLKNADGSAVLGPFVPSHDYSILANDDDDKYYESGNPSDKYYRLHFAEDAVATGSRGGISGYVKMSGGHKLEIQYDVPGDDSAVNVEFSISYNKVSTFSVERGNASIAST
jgi:hypothetical protein